MPLTRLRVPSKGASQRQALVLWLLVDPKPRSLPLVVRSRGFGGICQDLIAGIPGTSGVVGRSGLVSWQVPPDARCMFQSMWFTEAGEASRTHCFGVVVKPMIGDLCAIRSSTPYGI